MDPLTIITTALVAGAAAGGKNAASEAVRDAYTALRDRLTNVEDNSDTVAVIEANEQAPGADVETLEQTLRQHSTVESEMRSAAELVLSQLPENRIADARAKVDLRFAKGVQIGDHGTQHNTFE